MFSRINTVNWDKSLHVPRKVARLPIQGKCYPGGLYPGAVCCDPYPLLLGGVCLVSDSRTNSSMVVLVAASVGREKSSTVYSGHQCSPCHSSLPAWALGPLGHSPGPRCASDHASTEEKVESLKTCKTYHGSYEMMRAIGDL